MPHPNQGHSTRSGKGVPTTDVRLHKHAAELAYPSASIRRRKEGSGSQRSAAEIFNRAHAAWKNQPYDCSNVIVTKERARRIRLRIRKTFYCGGSEEDWAIEKGKFTYLEADNRFHKEMQALRRRLNATFSFLQMAEDYWAADFFVQEVFKVDKKYKNATKSWVHPKNRKQVKGPKNDSLQRVEDEEDDFPTEDNSPVKRAANHNITRKNASSNAVKKAHIPKAAKLLTVDSDGESDGIDSDQEQEGDSFSQSHRERVKGNRVRREKLRSNAHYCKKRSDATPVCRPRNEAVRFINETDESDECAADSTDEEITPVFRERQKRHFTNSKKVMNEGKKRKIHAQSKEHQAQKKQKVDCSTKCALPGCSLPGPTAHKCLVCRTSMHNLCGMRVLGDAHIEGLHLCSITCLARCMRQLSASET